MRRKDLVKIIAKLLEDVSHKDLYRVILAVKQLLKDEGYKK